MLKSLHRSGKALLSPDAWKIRVLFWSGAIIVGLVASAFAIVTEYVNEGFNHLLEISPYLPFLLCPLGLVLVATLTVRYFP
jgi:H+/Cl- antiporter ClcA